MEIAKASDCVVWKDSSGAIKISRKSTNGLIVAMFVTSLVGVILLINGFIFLTIEFEQGPNYPLALTLIGAGLFDLIMFFVLRKLKQKREHPENINNQTICTINNASEIEITSTGERYNIGDVSLARKFQIASSSPKLVLVTPKEKIVLVNGTPFAGGIYSVERYLKNIIPSAR